MTLHSDLTQESLPRVLAHCWELLKTGAADRVSPMHTPVLATTRQDGGANARVVVLRDADAVRRRLRIHTDARAAKSRELAVRGDATLVAYHPAMRVQLRVRLRAVVHHKDQVTRDAWRNTSMAGRRCYLSMTGPGAKASGPDSGLPATVRRRNPDPAESEAGFENFAVVLGRVTEMDWLWLRAEGHLRAVFDWSEAGELQARWLFP